MSKNYKKYAQANGDPIQVDSAIRDGNGKNIANNYAKQNGYYSGFTAGLAVNIKTNQGATVTDAIAKLDPISVAVEDGDFASMTNFKGRSFAYNQLVQNGNFANGTSNWYEVGGSSSTNLSVSNNILTWTKTASVTGIIQWQFNKISGHKYLVTAQVYPSSTTVTSFLLTGGGSNDSGGYLNSTPANTWTTKTAIITATSTGLGSMYFYGDFANTQAAGFTCKYKNIMVFDLTAMGINTTDVNEAIAALKSYNIDPSVYNEYSPGKIIDSQPNKIRSIGPNLFDINTVYSDTSKYTITGNTVSSSSPVNFFNTKRYFTKDEIGKTFTLKVLFTSRCVGTNLKIRALINNESVISGNLDSFPNYASVQLTPTSTNDYIRFDYSTCTVMEISEVMLNYGTTAMTYHPYIVNEYTITAPVMRSAGSVADDKDNAKVGQVDLGSLNYIKNTLLEGWDRYQVTISDSKNVTLNTIVANAICSKFICKSINEANLNPTSDTFGQLGYTFYFYTPSGTYADATAFKTAMSGVMLNYELATPTPQTDIILPTNIITYNGGTLETQYTSPNTTPGLVSMLYQVNLKNFIESLGAREDINFQPNEIVSKTEFNGTVEGLEKGLKDGSFVVKQSENSMSAQSLDTNIGVDDQTPFNYQTAGGDSDITTGIQSLKKLVGASVVFNQLTNWDDDIAEATRSDGITYSRKNGRYTLSGTATATEFAFVNKTYTTIAGHKYLFISDYQGTVQNNTTCRLYMDNSGATSYDINNKIFIASGTSMVLKFVYYNNATINCSFTAMFIDLTKMFGSQVADYLYNLTNNGGIDLFRSWYSKSYYPYTLKEWQHSKSAKLKMVDYNQWDGQITTNAWWNNTGTKSTTPNYDACANKIKVLGGTTYNVVKASDSTYPSSYVYVRYYDSNGNMINASDYGDMVQFGTTFTTPSNTVEMAFYSTFKNYFGANPKIAIFIYWDGSRIGYEPYQEHIYDLPNDELKGVLKVVNNKIVADGDEEYPDGTKKTRYSLYTFGDAETLTNFSASDGKCRFRIEIISINNGGANDIPNNIICNACPAITPYEWYNRTKTGVTIGINGYGSINYIQFSILGIDTEANAKAWLNGKTILYQSPTETETTSTAFAENIYVDDFGTMEFLDENNARITGIQGNEIFYKANISGFAESLYVKTDGDVDDIVTQEDVSDFVKLHCHSLRLSNDGTQYTIRIFANAFTPTTTSLITFASLLADMTAKGYSEIICSGAVRDKTNSKNMVAIRVVKPNNDASILKLVCQDEDGNNAEIALTSTDGLVQFSNEIII